MTDGINWKQAIAEVGLLFLGLSLALGADSYVESKREGAEEQQYLVQLKSDFESTASLFREGLADYEDQQAHARGVMAVLAQAPGSVAPDSVGRLVRKTFFWVDFVPVSATYRDMVNSGDLRLLQSAALRTALAEFESFIDANRDYNDIALDQWNSQVTPFMIEHFNISDLYGSEVPVPGGTEAGYDWGSAIARFDSDEESLWSREFANLVAVRMIGLGDTIEKVKVSLLAVEDILGLIEASIVEQ
jgi:hypothetical protein